MKLHRRLPEIYHWGLPPHIRRYLNDRGIPDAMITRFQLGWNGERITIPVYDQRARLAFFKLAKSPEDQTDSPKMLYYPAGASAELYGWETIRARPASVIICEGEYDRLVLEAHGFPAVTGTSGAAVFKEEWAKEIAKAPEVFICFDNDAAGQIGAQRVARLIPHAKVITLPPEVGEGGDVTDFFVRLKRSRENFEQLLKEAVPLPPPEKLPADRTAQAASLRETFSAASRLKEALRIEEIAGHYVTLRPAGRALMARCCFHDDQNPSLAVYPETQSFYCFACQKSGDIFSFLMAVEQLSFPEAVEALKKFTTLK